MGTGYTRADVSNNIADGNIINSADLDNEYDAIEAAFNSSTGHTHDGTSAEGGPITVVGPVQDLVVSATEVKPKTTNTLDLGTSALLYKDAYLQGNMYFRDTALKIVSSADGQLDIDADVELELVAPTVDIDASTAVTVDTASTTFTSTLFNVTGSANITGDLDVDNINIDGNTIISTDTNGAINITPNGTGAVNITATTNITGDLDVDNININGNTIISTDTNGNIALTPNGTGEVDISKVDIASGEIDGTTIGANSAAAGTFTNLTSTGTSTHATVDINGGNIDGTVIGASSAAAITGTTITGTSFVSSGDMTFGDNDKAIFGAGSDLQIYHDGGNSVIHDGGTGNLIIGAQDFQVTNSLFNENMITAANNGAVNLYYDNASKLATTNTGIDVTGTVTADGLTVDNAGVIRLNPSSGDDFLTIQQGGTQAVITADSTAGAGNLLFRTTSGGSDTDTMLLAANGDISFYDSTGVTQGFYWDASTQRLGLGTDSPSALLHLASNAPYINFEDVDNNQDWQLQATAWFALRNQTTNSELLRVTSGGNVGIGTTSPSANLEIDAGSATGTHLQITTTGSGHNIDMIDSSSTARIRNADGVLRLGADHNNESADSSIQFQVDGTEAIRIDSDGNVGIGTTSPATDLSVSSSGADAKIFVGRQVTSGNLSNTAAGGSIEFGSADSSTYAEYSGASIKLIADEAWTAGSAQGSALAFFVTADGTASLSEAMTITSAGEILVTGDGGGSQLESVFTNSGTAGNDNSVIRIRIGGTTARSVVQFGDDDDNNAGQIDYVHSTDTMQFDVSGSEVIRLDSDGLKFNADTSADNALDDYEQGSWTVDLQDNSGNSATSINGNGRYIKVGNLVTVWGRFSDPDLTGLTSGDDVRIYGLPFTASAFTGDGIQFIGSVRMENVTFASSPDGYVNTDIGEGTTNLRLVETRNNAADDFITVNQLSATSEMRFTATYPTTTF